MPRTSVRFWGVRGSIPAPGLHTAFYGGNTSCIELRLGEHIIVLDAGTGIRPLGLALKNEFKEQPLEITLLVTHTHWDHIQGFPFFVPAYCPRNKINILGFQGAPQSLYDTLSGQMDSTYFPVALQQMAGNLTIRNLKNLSFSIAEIPARAHFLNHPGACTGYRIGFPGSEVCYLPDIELFKRFRDRTESTNPSSHETDAADQLDDALTDFVRGAEVLILDAQYTAEEYEEHVGWGHSCMEDSVALALECKVKRLFLFHHDPDHTDEQITAMVARARDIVAAHQSSLIVDAAREGMELVLNPD